jgi:hypothetical protein
MSDTNTTTAAETPPANTTTVAETPPDNTTTEPASTPADVTPPPPTWPDNWRDALTKGDESRKSVLARLASPEAMADKLFEQEKAIRSGNKPAPFPAEGTPEQQSQWRKANGVPLDVAGYEIDKMEGLVIGDQDRPILDQFLADAHAANMPKSVIEHNVQSYFKIRNAEVQAIAERDSETKTEAMQALMQEYGGEYKRNLTMLGNYLSTLPDGLGDLIMSARSPEGVLLGNDPRVVRHYVGLMREANPAASVVPGGNEATIVSEIQSIETIRRTDPDKYWADRAMQTRYGELITAREAMKPASR